MTTLYGKAVGSYLIPFMISLAALGGLNGAILTGSRLIQTVSAEKDLPAILSISHSKFNTPVNAIVFQALWSVAFIFLGEFSLLVTAYSFTVWIFYGLNALALILFRKSGQGNRNAFKNWLITPVILALISCILLVIPFLAEDALIPAFICIGFILLAILTYFTKLLWLTRIKK